MSTTANRRLAPGDAPASQQALGKRNRERILTELASLGASTQAELARTTGFSHATVSNAVAKLKAEGLIQTEPTTSSGRRAVLVRLSNPAHAFAGIEIGPTTVRVALCRAGEATTTHEFALASADGTDLPAALGRARRYILEQCPKAMELQGMVLAVPLPNGDNKGVLGQGPGKDAKLAGVAPLEGLAVETKVMNSAVMAAYAQRTPGDPRTRLYIDAGATITAGLVVAGDPYTGTAGLAGQLGHMSVGNQGRLCQCGNRDCLDTVASTRSILEAMSSVRGAEVTLDQFINIAQRGDIPALRILESAAVALGRAAAAAALIINPSFITLGGSLSVLGPLLMQPFERSFTRAACPGIAGNTEITLNRLGPGVAALGAAQYAATSRIP